MVRAWYMDNDTSSDKKSEHHKTPPEFVAVEELESLTGVEYFKLNPETVDTDGVLDGIKKDRGYTYEDELVCSKECLPGFEEKLKIFYTEHLHTDEEIRYISEGSGYFDVRDKNDEWIRIAVECGDLLILPSGSYHRFTVDEKNFIRAKRLFIGTPVWTSYNRPCDDMPCRKEFVKKFANSPSKVH